MKFDLNLRDYLTRGKYPYEKLFDHMEAAHEAGHTVYVWSVPGFMMASGHQYEDEKGKARPWSDTQGKYYKTAFDAVNRRNGK